jgi:hypothetical protein
MQVQTVQQPTAQQPTHSLRRHIHQVFTVDVAIAAQAARAVRLTGPGIYFGDLARLCVFYWAIVSDVLLLKVGPLLGPAR